MIKFALDGKPHDIITSTFPGGEEHINIGKNFSTQTPKVVTITAELRSSKDIMQLLLVTEALRFASAKTKAIFELVMPYVPYARQDRRCHPGDAESLKVFCSLINNLKFDSVLVTDCHSSVGIALLNNVVAIPQLVASANVDLPEFDAVVAPDSGATAKASSFANHYNKPLIQCLKTRSGDIIDITVFGDVKGKKLLIVDDICDGGGTFISLAKELAEAESLHLYVTHGIFSKGKNVLNMYKTISSAYDWTETK